MNAFSAALLHWYWRHARRLPWRLSPIDRCKGLQPNPYHIWLSEIMLQQTTVRAVISYYQNFIELWPTVTDLATASSDDVMKAWAGLGYYSRARNLKKCADILVSQYDGHFPDTEEELKLLPGIGDYTAAAIAAIAFDRPAAVVDGNIERVMARQNVIATALPAAKKIIRQYVAERVPEEHPGDFAQAMMDLGATLCTPRNPSCVLCPVNETCQAYEEGQPEYYPVKKPRADKPTRYGAAFVLSHTDSGAVLLRRRPPRGLLGGMAEVPGTEWTQDFKRETALAYAPFMLNWQAIGTVEHVFTHFRLLLDIYSSETKIEADHIEHHEREAWWSPEGEVSSEALPTLMKKAIALARPELFAI